MRNKSRTIYALLILVVMSQQVTAGENPQQFIARAFSNLIAALPSTQLNQTQPQISPGRDLNREKADWQALEKVAPDSVETFKAAAEAFDRKDYRRAASLYQQVIDKAPGFDLAHRGLGSALALLGNGEEGLRSLERACKMNPSPENLLTFAQHIYRQSKEMESSEDNKLRALELAKKALAAYRAQNRKDDPGYAITVAQIASEVNDIGDLRVAARGLAADHPDLMQTHYFLALLAAHKEDWENAEKEIELARSLGLQGEIAQRFLDSDVYPHTRIERIWRYLTYVFYIALAWIACFVCLFTLGERLSKITLRSTKRADPSGGADAEAISPWRRIGDSEVMRYYVFATVVIFVAAAHGSSIIAWIWIAYLAALFMLGKLFSKIALRSTKGTDPSGGADAEAIPLWRWHKRLINVAVVYYYISPAALIFLTAAVTGSFIYNAIEWLPLKTMLIVIVIAATLIYKIIRSLFIRIESKDRGRALKPGEAPGLWELTREVAQAVGARPIDEIRVTPKCDLTVYEKGGLREKMQDRAKRVLILGVGALDGMKQNAFRALLAHEYGHFLRHGAGGDIARRLTEHIRDFISSIERRTYTFNAFLEFLNLRTWNLLIKFLRIYDYAFYHITHGARRLHEILADRVAAQNYGAESLEEGVRHVIRRRIEIEFNELKEAAGKRAVYCYNPKKGSQLEVDWEEDPEDLSQQAIEKKVNDIITQPTTDDDASPSPVDRFRMVQGIIGNPPQSSNAMVWDLFANRESLIDEMSKLINNR